MKPASQREEALFQAAAQLAGPARGAFLAQACEGDSALRQRLEVLLAAHDQPDALPATQVEAARPALKPDFADAPDEAVGLTLGRYKLLERVGEGGCGVVYVAEQTEPVRRRVALKVIKLGMDTRQVVARFEAERQALAMMDHPNIAKVLDAGTTDVGRPYFVMELVRGIRITDYCDQANLGTKDRLDLFIKVCQAIQHAHQKGIIHRDIKPSNILVTLHDGLPVPKVIDFGIAKATEGRLTDATVYTQLHQFIGTPAYMSPEQAEMSGLDMDTRSDIYSLGVLLYELLAGSTPFDAKELMASGIDAMRRTIREEEPMRPSTRLATLKGEELTTTARRRSVEAQRLIHLLKGDLDWIVMKCLEKDRTRRYETANGLAADLKRHLGNEPVIARPPSTAYRFQKAFRRNKLVFAAGTAVVIALIAGLGLAAVGLRQAVKERNSALAARAGEETQRREAQQAQSNEARLRREAEVHELATRRRAYASDMNLAQQSIAVNNFGRAQELLNRHRPATKSEMDFRGWEWRYLWQQCRSDAAFTLCRKPFEITSLTVSADGNWLAVAEHNKGGLSIWDLRTRQEVQRLDAGNGLVLASFSPREPLLAFAVASTNRTRPNAVRLWNGVTKEIVAELPLGGLARGVKFAGDGHTLVTSTVGENQIVLWRIPDGKKLASFTAPQSWDDDGTLLAVAGDLSVAAHSMQDGRFRVVDLSTGQERWHSKAVDRHATALEFSPDGKMLASGAGFLDRSARLWDVGSGKEIGRLEGHRGYIQAFVFWPDGTTLASASSDQTISLWDVGDPTRVPPPRILKGHQREVWRLALLPDNDTLVSGSQDGSVNFWHTKATRRDSSHFTLPEEFGPSQRTWRFAPDGQSILAVTGEGRVVRWHGTEFEQPQTWLELGSKVRAALISDDCLMSAAGSDNGTIRIWDLPNRKLLNRMETDSGPVEPRHFLAQGSRLLAYHRGTRNFAEWDLATGRRTRALPGDYDVLNGSAISRDRRWFLVGAENSWCGLFDLKANPANRRQLEIENLSRVIFSPDETLIAAGSGSGYVRIWETSGLRQVATVRNFLQGVHGVEFSVDGKRLMTSSDGHEALKLFDVENQQELLTLPALGSQFRLYAPSPDNNLIAARNDQGVVHVWRAPSFEEIAAAEAREKTEIQQP